MERLNQEYEQLEKLGSGTFGQVCKCRQKSSGRLWACKMLNDPIRDPAKLPEIYTDKDIIRHKNIIWLKEYFQERTEGGYKVALIFELMDTDLSAINAMEVLPECYITGMIYQILSGLAYLHRVGHFHADIKPENILVKLPEYTIKIGDLGNSHRIADRLPHRSSYVATRWYRPPEVILTNGFFGPEMDVWATGCIMLELYLGNPVFQGSDELEQIQLIIKMVGFPSIGFFQRLKRRAAYDETRHKRPSRLNGIQKLLKEMEQNYEPDVVTQKLEGPLADWSSLESKLPKTISSNAKDFYTAMLAFDPATRISPVVAMSHPYLKNVRVNEAKLFDGYPSGEESEP